MCGVVKAGSFPISRLSLAESFHCTGLAADEGVANLVRHCFIHQQKEEGKDGETSDSVLNKESAESPKSATTDVPTSSSSSHVTPHSHSRRQSVRLSHKESPNYRLMADPWQQQVSKEGKQRSNQEGGCHGSSEAVLQPMESGRDREGGEQQTQSSPLLRDGSSSRRKSSTEEDRGRVCEMKVASTPKEPAEGGTMSKGDGLSAAREEVLSRALNISQQELAGMAVKRRLSGVFQRTCLWLARNKLDLV